MAGYSLKSLSRSSFFLPASNQWSSFPTSASATLLECISAPYSRGAKRPSCLDLVTLLRKQLVDHPTTFATGKAPVTYQTMVGAAAA